MFSYCCPSKTEADILKEEIEKMKKQIHNIYELLEVLTNESKSKFNLNNDNNRDVPKENDDKSKQTYFLDKTTVWL